MSAAFQKMFGVTALYLRFLEKTGAKLKAFLTIIHK
jgi:hypothetical protein